MKTFSYRKPKSLKEAIALLKRHREKAQILAGGTDLLVEYKNRLRPLSHVIDIKGIASLDGIAVEPKGHLRLGPLVTMQALSTHPALVDGLSVLSQAASKIGSWQIRNRATLGGNICHGSPSGDTLPALLCLNAQVKLAGPKGERKVPVEDFFLGPGKTAAEPDEILTEILIPRPPPRSVGVYKKLAPRRAMDLAVVGVAVLGSFDPPGEGFADIRIGLGAVASIPLRAKAAENLLRGAKVHESLIIQAADLASAAASPISDVRGSAWYRREMIQHLVEETLRETLAEYRKDRS